MWKRKSSNGVDVTIQDDGLDTSPESTIEPSAVETKKPTVFEKSLRKLHIHFSKKLAWLISVLILLVVVIWAIGGIFFTRYKVGNTNIWARESDAQISQTISSLSQQYKLAIVYPGGQQSRYTLQQMGVQASPAATITSIRHQKLTLTQRLYWWTPINMPLSISINNAVFSIFLQKDATFTIQPPEDAKLSIANGAVQITGGSAGKQYGLTNDSAVLTAAKYLQNQPIHLTILVVHPTITPQQLKNSETELKNVLSQRIAFTIEDHIITASPNDIAAWIELTPTNETNRINITVDSGKVLNYINSIASPFTHPPRDQVQITRADGTIAQIVGGQNGVDVQNKQSVATTVTGSLLSAKSMNLTLAVSFMQYKTISTLPYAKWIEIDTTNKQMYAYQQADLVRTFLVSAGAPATPTVTGQFTIYTKYTKQNMRGANVDGSSYYQPNVPWVNYFYKDYAIHGNYWRPLSYFGNINSSHGCVGLIDSDAQWVYNWAPIGTPVIVHA